MGDTASGGVIEGSDGRLYGATIAGGTHGDGVVYSLKRDGTGYTVLHQFQGQPSDGGQSAAALSESAGILYGTTGSGGSANGGAAFKINQDGSGYAVLHHFGSSASDGKDLQAGILVGSDGVLYGATRKGGTFGAGTLFKMNSDGSNYSVFYNFVGSSDGEQARGTLIEISNRLYGTTSNAGDNGSGVVFAVNKDGSDFAVLHAFGGGPVDGANTWSGLLHGSDGALYGTTLAGGSGGKGIIFKVNTDGSNYEVLHHFGGANDGQEPWAGLLEGADGKLYGAANTGGLHINGTVFRLNKNGSNYEVLHHFDGGIGEGYRPQGTLIRSTDGAIYGTTREGGIDSSGIVYKVQPDGSAFTTLHDFSGCGGDGMRSSSKLLAASDGYFYGTTLQGGAFDYGVVFKMRPDASNYQILHNFRADPEDGINPYEGLSEGAEGVLYGSTRFGGGSAEAGTIFKLNKDGSAYEVIHRFTKTLGTAYWPAGEIVVGSDGKLYSRSLAGGQSDVATVFRLNRDGSNFEILHEGSLDGGNEFYAYGGLIEASDGRLYGNSIGDGDQGGGAVFGMNKDGSNFKILHHFSDTGTDGRYPEGGVIEASDGKLYGTTSAGGEFDWGMLFRVNKDGTGYTILHHFNSANAAAYYPVANLHEGPGGTLFGITYFGGSDDSGTIYMFNPAGGGVTILQSFIDADRVGVNPNATLIRGPDGGMYSVAPFGGEYGCGSLFRIAPIGATIAKEAAGYRMRITGKIGQLYAIERAETVPSTWLEIGQAENLTGVAEFLDPSNSNVQRFYRSRLLLP
ncbi:MAG TPA: choice-of-anchor tandem repeat GloVer-containing protein [Verrucomicrobiae bacterium]|nr:choice-of-anchor tandem repeat GloVer-containing protein [Verrucomicrobiae bacterium]